MAYCHDCGAEVEENTAYCAECGAELNTNGGEEEAPESDENDIPATESVVPESDGIDWRHAVIAVLIGFIPALGAYMSISIAANEAVGIVLLGGIVGFGYVLYQRPTVKAMIGGMCFWLSIEAFLTPFFLLIYTLVFASQQTTTGAEQAGAAIGGFLLVIVAFVVGLPVGIVLYLISRRLDVDGQDQTDGVAGSTQTA